MDEVGYLLIGGGMFVLWATWHKTSPYAAIIALITQGSVSPTANSTAGAVSPGTPWLPGKNPAAGDGPINPITGQPFPKGGGGSSGF